jgi:hypothetical protein
MGRVRPQVTPGRNAGESQRQTIRAVTPTGPGQASTVRAAVREKYLPQKKLLGRRGRLQFLDVAERRKVIVPLAFADSGKVIVKAF